MAGASADASGAGDAEAQQALLARELARQKAVYREGFVELKALKAAIAGLQGQLEREAKGRAQHALAGVAHLAERQEQDQEQQRRRQGSAKQAWG